MPKLRAESANTSTSEVFSLRTNREQLSALDDLAAFLTSRGEGATESGGVVTRQAAARRALTAGIRALREAEAPAPVDELRGAAVLRALADLDLGAVRALVAALQSSAPAPAVAASVAAPDPRQTVIPGTLPEGPVKAPQSPSAARSGATPADGRDDRRTGAERRKRDRRAEAARAQESITAESAGKWFRLVGTGGRPGASAAHRVESVAGQEVRFYCGRAVPDATKFRPINPEAPGKFCDACSAKS